MVKAGVKSRPAGKDALLAVSKKSKSLEKKVSKKIFSTIQSPEAKKLSLILKKEQKNKIIKKEVADIKTESVAESPKAKKFSLILKKELKIKPIKKEAADVKTKVIPDSPKVKKLSLVLRKEQKSKQIKKKAAGVKTKVVAQSPEMEIKLKSKVLLKPQAKNSSSKSNRFDEMKKIHKVLKEKKLMKAKREEEDQDSDESTAEDDGVCKSYALNFGMDENDSMDEDEPSKEEGAESSEGKDAKSTIKEKKEFVNPNDPAEQARSVFLTNVSLKTTSKQIMSLMKTYGKVLSVRLRNLPVKNLKTKGAVKLQAKLKQFKKEATSCCAYVRFQLPEQATAALAANTSVLNDHHIFVLPVESKSREAKRRDLAAGKQVVVGNLPFFIEAEPLYREFEGCGDIVRISLPKNKEGRSIGVGFIEFKEKTSVQTALKKQGVKMLGREIRVSKAVKKVKKSDSTGPRKDNKKNSPAHKNKAPKKRVNKDELKKMAIARKLAAKK